MHLRCTVKVSSCTDGSVVQASANCYLHVGRYQGSEKWILLVVTSRYPRGKEYELEGNLHAVHDKFIREGKATIVFKTPKEQLEIKDTISFELRTFLRIVSNASLPKKKMKNFGSHIIYPALIKKPTPVRRNVYASGEFTEHVHPQTVSLVITARSRKFDDRILQLKMLRELDLSNNHLKELPAELGNMPLTLLNLGGNNLGRSDFMWLEQQTIKNSLVDLNLAANNLTEFPLALVDFGKLRKLILLNNSIKSIPNKLGRHPSLMELDLADNYGISRLPISFASTKIEQISMPITMNVANDDDDDDDEISPFRIFPYLCRKRFPTLKDLATITISSCSWSAELSLANLPRPLLNDVRNTSECKCGRTSMPYPDIAKHTSRSRGNFRTVMRSLGEFDVGHNGNMRCVYHKCFRGHGVYRRY